VPEWMSFVMLFVNLGVPILALVWGWRLNVHHKKRKKAEAEAEGKVYVPISMVKLANESPMVQRQRRLVERNINEYTLRFLVHWTMVLVLCSCLAGGIISMGSFAKVVMTPVQGASSPNDIPSTVDDCAREEFMRATEYVGFPSWHAFTENCCCMPRTAVPANTTALEVAPQYATELWACTTNSSASTNDVTYKERPRRSAGMAAPLLRPFCGLTFTDLDGEPLSVQEPVWSADRSKFGLPYVDENGTANFFTDFW